MATVRIFTHHGLTAAELASGGKRPVTDAVFLFKEPYLAGETLTPTTGAAASSSADTAPRGTAILRIQIDGGKRVHYEVTPSNGQALREATVNSPIISGDDMVDFAEGYRISMLEVTES